MMRRRDSPYSLMERVSASRGELVALVLVTLALGLLLGLLTNSLYDWLRGQPPAGYHQRLLFWLDIALTLVLGLAAAWLLYGLLETEPARVEIAIPYHLPGGEPHQRQLSIVRRKSYQLTVHAQRATQHRFPRGSPELLAWLAGWDRARAGGERFQDYAHALHAELAQCLLLYALHRYGELSVGSEARFYWWQVPLPAVPWTIDKLPPPLDQNPFLLADQGQGNWRLLLPAGVTLHLLPDQDPCWPRWELRHRRYGRVIIAWSPFVAVDGVESKTGRVLTHRLHPDPRTEVHILRSRFEARARLRWTLWKGSDPFHRWAAGLLARLEESLDLIYYLESRPERIIEELEWKVGWVDRKAPLAVLLARIEARLEDLEMRDPPVKQAE
ncbi:MAG: hypothetical protein JXA37_13045 [Chloroflexia bacterium]|nr:hypothetical protein [Chloroflexia bacterium]